MSMKEIKNKTGKKSSSDITEMLIQWRMYGVFHTIRQFKSVTVAAFNLK